MMTSLLRPPGRARKRGGSQQGLGQGWVGAAAAEDWERCAIRPILRSSLRMSDLAVTCEKAS